MTRSTQLACSFFIWFGLNWGQFPPVDCRLQAQEASQPVLRLPVQTAEIVAGLDAYIEQARVDWAVPGLSVAIVQGEEILLCRGYGQCEVGREQPVDEHTLFAIASNTKAFTAAAMAMLVDEGKLDWDDRVSQYLPWLRLKDPLATNDLRVRDLLCHRSGLGTFSGDLLWWGTEYTPREVLQRAAELEPAGPFRAHYGYSNLMFLAAGEIIEQVSGQSWADFVRQRILQPLNMQRSVCSTGDLPEMGNYATPHKTLPESSMPLQWTNWDSMVAAGGIISSAADMACWMQCQLRGGASVDGKVLYSQRQSREMWSSHMPMPLSAGYSARFPSTHFRAYGLGWSLADYHGTKTVGHGGGYDGMYSQLAMMPERQLGVIVLTNSMTPIGTAITTRVLDAMCGVEARDWSGEGLAEFRKLRVEFQNKIDRATTAVVQGTRPGHPLQDYCGLYRCPMYGDVRIELDGQRLVLKLLPNRELIADLEHLHYETFVINWRSTFAWFDRGTANFVADARGVVHRIELDVPNDDFWFYELKLKRVAD